MDHNHNVLVLKNRIMRKIYFIWFLRKLTSVFAIKIAVPVVLLSLSIYRIHFFNVFKNAIDSSSSFYDIPSFFFNSFWAAEIFDQFIVLGLVAFVGAIVWDIFKKRIPTLLLSHLLSH